jgi:hypothetical protein
MICLLILASSLLSCLSSSFAATYYCSPEGNDSRTPAQGQLRVSPFKTIGRAIEVIRDGDDVVLLDGLYFISGLRHPSATSSGGVDLTSLPQTTASDFKIRSERKWGAQISTPTGSGSGLIRFAGISGITLEGMSTRGGNLIFQKCSNPFVRDCLIETVGGGGVVFAECDWIRAEWNIIKPVGSSAGSGIVVTAPEYLNGPSRPWGIWIRNNTIFGTSNGLDFGFQDAAGVTIYDRPSMIENNFVFDLNSKAQSRAALELRDVQNVRVRNNTLVRDFGFEGLPMVNIENSDRIYVYNNIIAASNETPAIELTGNTETLVFANVVEGTEIPAEVEMMNYIGSPEFDPGTLIPSAYSPAVNNAFDAGDHFFLDVFGGPRYNGPLDIGAIER